MANRIFFGNLIVLGVCALLLGKAVAQERRTTDHADVTNITAYKNSVFSIHYPADWQPYTEGVTTGVSGFSTLVSSAVGFAPKSVFATKDGPTGTKSAVAGCIAARDPNMSDYDVWQIAIKMLPTSAWGGKWPTASTEFLFVGTKSGRGSLTPNIGLATDPLRRILFATYDERCGVFFAVFYVPTEEYLKFMPVIGDMIGSLDFLQVSARSNCDFHSPEFSFSCPNSWSVTYDGADPDTVWPPFGRVVELKPKAAATPYKILIFYAKWNSLNGTCAQSEINAKLKLTVWEHVYWNERLSGSGPSFIGGPSQTRIYIADNHSKAATISTVCP